VGGLLANPKLSNLKRFGRARLSPALLWYRLFPNATYPEGLCWPWSWQPARCWPCFIWLGGSRRWAERLADLVYAGACLVFLAGIGDQRQERRRE